MRCSDGHGFDRNKESETYGKCIQCSLENCRDCNDDSTVCVTCNDHFRLKKSDEGEDVCSNCTDQNCLQCPDDESVCTVCDVGYATRNNNDNTISCILIDGSQNKSDKSKGLKPGVIAAIVIVCIVVVAVIVILVIYFVVCKNKSKNVSKVKIPSNDGISDDAEWDIRPDSF